MHVLDLFSGIGGFSLGLERAGMRTVAFCETDPFCRRVLAKHWPDVPVYDDVRTLTGVRVIADVGPVDLVCGGFPCQPWSVAGKRAGRDDDRDLWPEMHRLVGELRPRWVLGENVPGLDDKRFMALDGVLADLEAIDYQAGAVEIPACAVNAPHIRNRVWILAHADGAEPSERYAQQNRRSPTDAQRLCGGGMANGIGAGLAGRQGQRGDDGEERAPAERDGDVEHADIPNAEVRHLQWRGQQCGLGGDPGAGHWNNAGWLACPDGKARRVEPGLRLLAHGVPERVARLRALGNAVVPRVVEQIGRAIMMADEQT